MRSGRSKKMNIILTTEEQEQLESFANSRSLSFGLVTHARIIILTTEQIVFYNFNRYNITSPFKKQQCYSSCSRSNFLN